MALIAPDAGRAHVVGVTGAPGRREVDDDQRARRRPTGRAATGSACSPSTRRRPFSGGALLGDRIRMSGPRGRPGGLHPLDGLARPPRRAVVGGAAGAAGARRRGLRRRAARDGRGGPVGGRGRRHRRHHRWCCSRPAWATASRRPRRASSRSADVLVVNKADREGADRTVRDLRHAAVAGRRAPSPARGGCRWCAPWRPRAPGVDDLARRGRGAPRPRSAPTGCATRRVRRAAPRGRGAGPGGAAGAGRRAARRQPARRAGRRRGRRAAPTRMPRPTGSSTSSPRG